MSIVANARSLALDVAPKFTSPDSFSVPSGQTYVGTVTVEDPDTTDFRFSIIGGADASKFIIDQSTGDLSFIDPPDVSDPVDTGGDNRYEVKVLVEGLINTSVGGDNQVQRFSRSDK